jgi:hypothetical protein
MKPVEGEEVKEGKRFLTEFRFKDKSRFRAKKI